MFGVGYFFMGFGINPPMKIIPTILAEVFHYDDRQHLTLLLAMTSGVGCLATVPIFYLLNSWRWHFALFQLLPMIATTCVSLFFLKKTPKFLVKDKQQAVKDLNEISKINHPFNPPRITIQDIENVIRLSVETGEYSKMRITPLSLFTFPSIRKITFTTSAALFALSTVYFGQIVTITKMGFDPGTGIILLSVSEIVALATQLFIVNITPRKKIIFFLFCLIGVLVLVSGFISPGEDCNNCLAGKFELGLAFVIKFFCAHLMSFIYIYML